jgi:hypothetical protein
LECYNQFVEIAKLGAEQQVEHSQALEAAEQNLPELARRIVRPIRITAFHRHRAELRCAAVMVAVERYRRATNRWPDALIDLVPAYLPSVPLDPFAGTPLHYRRLDDGVVIYSFGPDGKDNGGNLDEPDEPFELIHRWKKATDEGTDLGFRLWDVPQRRQLPKREPAK